MKDVLESAAQAGVPRDGPDRAILLDTMRRAQIAYLRVALGRRDPAIDTEDLDVLRRHAMYLDLLAEGVGTDQATDARHVVGTIYEWLSRLAPGEGPGAALPGLTRGKTGDLVRSSLAYSSGRHEASSAFAAQRALEAFEELRVDEPILLTTALTILRLLARRLAEAITGIEDYGRAIQDMLAAGPSTATDWPTIGLTSRIAEACACQAAAMLSGSNLLFEEAADRLALARRLAATGADDVAALVDRLARVVTEMRSRSTFEVLRRAGLPEPLVRTYAARRPELWTNQVEAIDAGFLDVERGFVLSLSTGSGKTFLSQLRILATLDRYPDSWVAYIAPTRALVREVHADLSRALRPHGVRVQKLVAGAEATMLTDADEVPVVTARRTCAVLTPERLDVYLRANPELAERCRLVVVDEAHHISDIDRGPRLESLVARLITQWPNAKPVLLSAFLPNAAELQAWLGGDAGVYRSSARPTRQLRGVFLRYNEQQLPDAWVYGTGAQKRESTREEPGWRKWRRRRRAYDVGAILATDATPATRAPTDVRAYALPAVTRGITWTEESPPRQGRRGKIDYVAGTGVADIAVDVGVALANHPGLVLMFFPSVTWAQSAASRIAADRPQRPDMEPFARAAGDFIGTEHPLVEALQHGCAYHHAQLPDEVLRIVEAASLSRLDVLCATPGLQAGVNLPASIAVVVGDPTKEGTNPSPRDFANMAGRAGRPGFETEGLALYLPPSIHWGNPLASARPYLDPRDEELAVTSPLAAELLALMDEPEGIPLEDLPDVIQQMLLGLWAVELREPEQIGAFLSNTLAGAPFAERLGEDFASALSAAAEQRGPQFSAFARTALPYSTCGDLAGLEDDLVGLTQEEAWQSARTQVAGITRLLLRLPYFTRIGERALGRDYTIDLVVDLVLSWVEGNEYRQISRLLEERTGHSYALPRTVRATSLLTGYLAWGTGSLIAVVASHREIEGLQPLLAYLVRFGVDSPVAGYLRLLGVSDRLGAMVLAADYPDGREVTLQSVEAWAATPEARAILRGHYGDNSVSMSAIERDLGLEVEPTGALPSFFAARGDHPDWLVRGSLVSIDRVREDEWAAREIITGTSWPVREVPGQGIAAVRGVEGDRLLGVLFVPVDDQRVFQTGVR